MDSRMLTRSKVSVKFLVFLLLYLGLIAKNLLRTVYYRAAYCFSLTIVLISALVTLLGVLFSLNLSYLFLSLSAMIGLASQTLYIEEYTNKRKEFYSNLYKKKQAKKTGKGTHEEARLKWLVSFFAFL